MIEINKLDVINSRKVNFIPRHFSKIKINENSFFDSNLEVWIKNKLKNRYAIEVIPTVCNDSNNNSIKMSTIVAFEDSKELTYFMLACPFLRRQ